MTERGTLFSDLHAVVQAWQPMHLVWSKTLAQMGVSSLDPLYSSALILLILPQSIASHSIRDQLDFELPDIIKQKCHYTGCRFEHLPLKSSLSILPNGFQTPHRIFD